MYYPLNLTTSFSKPFRTISRFLVAGAALSLCVTGAALEFYVAPGGDDTNTGTEGSPFATMEKARDAVRAALPSASEGIDVWFSEGSYYFPNSVEFGVEDSGTESVPVRYAGKDGATVELSGAMPFDDLEWSVYSGGIMKADVGTGISCDVMFVNGTQQVMARYPNFDPEAVVLNGTASDAISLSRTQGWANPAGGFVRALHSKRWGGNSYKITGKTSAGGVTTAWVGDNNRGSGMHSEFRMVENIFEELDAAGEWFYDKDSGILYFYPPEGLDLSNSTIELATTEELIRIVGSADDKVGYLTFDNFTFSKTHRTLFTRPYEKLNRSDWCVARAGTVFIQDASSITISNSIFDHVGGNAIFLSGYNRDHLITENEFLENGATCVNVCGSKKALQNFNEWDTFVENGVTQGYPDADGKLQGYVTQVSQIVDVAGPKTEDYPKDITISFNHMENMGRYEKQTAGVNLFLSESITIAHNTIHGSPRSGLNVCDGAWGGHIFEFNDVFDCVKETEDHGPFNAWGRDRFYSIGGYNHGGSNGAVKRPYAFYDAWKTTIIRNNRFHYSEEREFGIDLDDGSSNYEIYNNLILNTSVKLREGFNRKVYNNIMVNRGPDLHVWYADCRDEVTNNIIIGNTAYNPIGVGSSVASSNNAVIENNLFFNSGNDVNVVTDDWPGVDLNSVTANPRFVDPEHLDYTVKDDSPALALGFVNFPMDQFGKPGSPEPEAVEFIDEPPAESDGDPFLGASLASIYSVAVQSSLGAADMNGVHFELLPEASYAAEQGFHVRDAILEINGVKITTKDSFYEVYNKIMPGATIDAVILREQEDRAFSFSKPITQTDLNDTAGVVYTGDWVKEIAETSIGGDLHTTSTLGDSFEIEFYGTGISLKAFTSSASGQVDIYIDDVFDSTIDLSSASDAIRQVVYTKSGLTPAGLHTLKAVNKEAKRFAFDAYDVEHVPLFAGEFSVVASGSETAPVPSNTDLAQTYYLSSSATGGDEVADQHAELFNGTVGTASDNTGEVGNVRMGADNTITINFDLSENYLGYDVTGINSYFGWNTGAGGRSNQGYAIRFYYVDGSTSNIPGQHWNPNSPAFYWTTVSFTGKDGGVLASGVKAITFDITENAIPGNIVIGREFDILGTPVALPEPDFDNDGTPDSEDSDDDNDGYLDVDDAFQFDATEWSDLDGDGIGDNADTDDDNDGVLDVDEVPVSFVNISTRAYVTDGNGVVIGGVVIDGTDPMMVLIQGVGSELKDDPFGLGESIEDTVITLYDGDVAIASNDDWDSDSTEASDISDAQVVTGSFVLDDGGKSAALLIELDPGAYTVLLQGKDGASGIGLVEVYNVSSKVD